MPPRLSVRVALPRARTRARYSRPLILPQPSLSSRPFQHLQARLVHNGWNTAPIRGKPTRFNQPSAGLPPLTTGPAAALKRRENTTPLRSGVLAIKKGMTSMFVGKVHVPCTVLQLDQVQVTGNKTRESNGYWAVQVGIGARNQKNVSSAMLGFYEAKGMAPKDDVAEFMVKNQEGLLPIGTQLMPDWFKLGQYVDVRSKSRGMGFAGVMKRHGFSGQEASHGNSKNHRTPGSSGQSQGGGSRVYPGKKMPGRMGNQWVTVQNLKIMKVDNELGIVLVSGPIAGPKGQLIKLQDSKKRKAPSEPHRQKALQLTRERQPGLEARLAEARELHRTMKEMRRSLIE